jgi:hypothetical protein
MSNINEGYRSQPRQNKSYYPDASSVEQKGCTESHRPDNFSESLHLEAGATQSVILYSTKRLCKNRVGCRATKSFQKLKELL